MTRLTGEHSLRSSASSKVTGLTIGGSDIMQEGHGYVAMVRANAMNSDWDSVEKRLFEEYPKESRQEQKTSLHLEILSPESFLVCCYCNSCRSCSR